MADLIAKSPFQDTLPLTHGTTTLAERHIERAVAISPFAGRTRAVSAALKTVIGLGLPEAGESSANGPAGIIWFGRDKWLVLGADLPEALRADAALTEQADAWACLTIDGPLAEATLARLIPLDLRAAHFAQGKVARSLIGHMSASIIRTGPQAFDLMVMRSMARSLLHEVHEALRSVTARSA